MNECLVAVDVQRGFISDRTKYVVPLIASLPQKKHFDFIVATQFQNMEGSPYTDIMHWRGLMTPEAQQVAEEIAAISDIIIPKNRYTCFNEKFEAFVRDNNIHKLYFVGIDTDCCVLKSASDCFEKNIPFEVLINYCASNGGEKSHQAAITVLNRMVGRNAINSSL